MEKSVMLVKVSANENNNKFYEVVLSANGSVTKRWGRVGTEGTTSVEHTGETGFNRVVQGKKRRGYKEVNTVSHTSSTHTVESRKLGSIARQALLADTSVNDTKIQNLIERLIDNNRHQIMETSGGMIQVDDDGVMKTPLGIIDQSNIVEARKILTRLKEASPASKTFISSLEDYLSLVPQKVAARRGWHESFLEGPKFAQQLDFLEQLEKSYEWYQQTLKSSAQETDKDSETAHENLFRYKLSQLDDTKKFDQIQDLYRRTLNRRHSASTFKLKYVYQLQNEVDLTNFTERKDKLGNVQELWHGTNVANVLSILSKGLFIPPRTGSTIQTVGRMFGDGIYFSNQSTKSLNYSTGFWGGGRQSMGYMFLADVVLGKEYHPSQYGPQTAIRKSHNSIFVEPNTAGVRNNEVIVWDTNQIMLRYLCEFTM